MPASNTTSPSQLLRQFKENTTKPRAREKKRNDVFGKQKSAHFLVFTKKKNWFFGKHAKEAKMTTNKGAYQRRGRPAMMQQFGDGWVQKMDHDNDENVTPVGRSAELKPRGLKIPS